MEVLETEDPLGSYRSELFAHCYRMLGSHHDAEDVLQEVSLRAPRGRAEFEGRSSLRTWLHRITVNACLNELDRKESRIMPIDYGPEAGPDDGFDNRLEDVLWVEPMPSDPQQRAEYLVSIELAFVVAVQHLAANQRAALIMFDVLGFSAAEIAEAMATTPASVNSALQRARERLAAVLPAHSQRAGCLLTAAATEFDGRRGEVRDLIATAWHEWRLLLVGELRLAIAAADLPPEYDADQAVFELTAVGPALNQALQLDGDLNSPERARCGAQCSGAPLPYAPRRPKASTSS